MAIDADTYRSWIENFDTLGAADLEAARSFCRSLPRKPSFDVVMPVHDPPEVFLLEAIESVRRQVYPHWTLCIFDDASAEPYVASLLERVASEDGRIRVARGDANRGLAGAFNAALELGSGEYVLPLDHDDLLRPHALLLFAEYLSRFPDAGLLTPDADLLDGDGKRASPIFKPEYDHELLLGYNLVPGAMRRSLLEELGGLRSAFPGSEDYDLSLRAVERLGANAIRRVPHILYHWRMVPSSLTHTRMSTAIASAHRAVREHCERLRVPAHVGPARRTLAWNRVRALPDPQFGVDIVIECREGVEGDHVVGRYPEKTDYPAATYVHCVSGGPVGAVRNQVALGGSSDLIAFVDARLLPRNREWLTEMASHFVYDSCAAVGARIVGADGRVEQNGVLLGVREVGAVLPVTRAMRGATEEDLGYCGRVELAHSTSAIAGGVILVRRKALQALGGFDETLRDTNCVDLDFCLRARARGMTMVTCPHAVFDASEPAPWFADVASAQALRERWGPQFEDDPYYSPNLSDVEPGFSLAFPPRVAFPWRS
jgi:GT2 family glycosyltransferase